MKTRSVYSFSGCVALFVTISVGGAGASTVQTCVAQACKNSPGVWLREFLQLENSGHPQLEEFFGQYRSDIHKIRQQRRLAAKSALEFLSDPDHVVRRIRSLSNSDLMKLLIQNPPWNIDTVYAGREIVFVAEPLSSNLGIHWAKVLNSMFSRFQKTSPLFLAHLRATHGYADVRAALNVGLDVDIAKYTKVYLTGQISRLPSGLRRQYLGELSDLLRKIEELGAGLGERIYLSLGNFDLEVQASLGRIDFQEGERKLVEQAFISIFNEVLANRSDGFAKLESIYSPSKWDEACLFAFNRALHYGLTQAERDRVESELRPEAIRRSQNSLAKIFGLEVNSKITEFLATLQFVLPQSLPEYVERVERMIQFEVENSEKTVSSLSDVYDLAIGVHAGNDAAVASICNAEILSPIGDSASGNSVRLSPFSAKNPNFGLFAAIHEIAHSVSDFLRKIKEMGVNISPFEEIRECLSLNYRFSDTEPGLGLRHFSSDKPWTEEDWADAFAAYATSDLDSNTACSFLGALPKNDYTNMEERSYQQSPAFYRILNVHSHIGHETPPLCKVPLERDYEALVFRDCISKFASK